jgi:hypothetical protein
MEAWKRVASVGGRSSVLRGVIQALSATTLANSLSQTHRFCLWCTASIMNTSTVHGDQQSLESLRLQKDAVKRELKLFDVHFAKFYGRQPSRLDKECLRKLYEFHKQLKAYIAAEEVKMERRQR